MKLNHQQWIRTAGVTLIARACPGSAARSIRAQTPDAQKQVPEEQQLKERVKQLEQMVEELKVQINAIEGAKAQPASTATGENVAAPVNMTGNC